MAETGGLENHCAGNRTGGSNPSPSATFAFAYSELGGIARGIDRRQESSIPRDCHDFVMVR